MVLLVKFDLLMVSFYWLAEFKNLRTSASVSVLLRIAGCSEHMPWVITLYVQLKAELPLIILIFTSVCCFLYTQC